MKWPGRYRDINWEPGCIDCNDAFPLALLLTVFAMPAHPRAMIRYIRTGEEPS